MMRTCPGAARTMLGSYFGAKRIPYSTTNSHGWACVSTYVYTHLLVSIWLSTTYEVPSRRARRIEKPVWQLALPLPPFPRIRAEEYQSIFLANSSSNRVSKCRNKISASSKQETLRSQIFGFLCPDYVLFSLITRGHIFACKIFAGCNGILSINDTLTGLGYTLKRIRFKNGRCLLWFFVRKKSFLIKICPSMPTYVFDSLDE